MAKCADCGLLAVRNATSRELTEAEEGFRIRRDIPSAGKLYVYDEVPVCFARAASLLQESGNDTDKEKVLAVIHHERDCLSFVKWDQGFSPKEHVEKMYNDNLIKMQRDEADADRKWREQEALRDHAWRVEQAERERGWRLEDRSLAMSNLFVAAGVGIISAVATLLAANMLPWAK